MPYVNQRGFTRGERKKLEKLHRDGSPKLFDNKFYQELTDKFNRGATSDAISIEVEQVRRWFTSQMEDLAREATSTDSKELVSDSDSSDSSDSGATKESVIVADSLPSGLKEFLVTPVDKVSDDALENTSNMPEEIEEEIDEDEWEFEARSYKEGAWYDVATFLSYRTNSAGDPEVRVRFREFGAEEDEWVDVKKAIRERSIPLDSSDCQLVAIGDPVLCFRVTSDRQAHFDAHVMKIQRREHDESGCRCLFIVRYEDDLVEETVEQKGLCRRPMNKSANGNFNPDLGDVAKN